METVVNNQIEGADSAACGAHARQVAPNAARRKPRKHRARLVLVVACAICAIACGSYAAYAATLATPSYAWYLDHAGEDTFTLSSAGDIYGFAQLVNGTADVNGDGKADTPAVSFQGKTVVLSTAGGNNSYKLNDVGTSFQFTPIGTADHPFEGTFDGQNCNLSNLLITDRNDSYTGLFGLVSSAGAVKNVSVGGRVEINAAQQVSNIGGIVGDCEGLLSGCSSSVAMNVTSSLAPTDDISTTMKNIGGVVGRANGPVTGCSFSGSLAMSSDKNAVTDKYNNAINVAQNIGGVAGLFGEDTLSASERAAGSITGCTNSGNITLSFTGTGGIDRFNEQVLAKPGCVGGIVGYSDGSIASCKNTGTLRTSTPGTDGYGYGTTNDNGASQCGGIVGNLRSVIRGDMFSTILTPDNGSKDDVLTVSDCVNTGEVIAANTLGGIVGTAGTYTTITRCSNGNFTENNKSDGTFADPDKGAVISTRWNKPFAAGIVGVTLGNVSFSYNRAQVNNTQGGFYCAGIAGALGSDRLDTLDTIKNDSTYTAELHSCWNSGMIGLGHKGSNKYGALVGDNEGYIHDCVVLEGCVITGQKVDENGNPIGGSTTSSDAVGDLAWKQYSNITVLSLDKLKTSDGLSALNNYCAAANGFATYWYSNVNNNDTYPVLNTWVAPSGQRDLGTIELSEKSVADAKYSASQDPVPQVSLVSGATELHQNVDYIIIPQKDARTITQGTSNAKPYQYSVQGIGNYAGMRSNFGYYGIGAGSLQQTSVIVSSPKFNWEVQFPDKVTVLDSMNQPIDSADYSYVIYDSHTNNLRSSSSTKDVVFDSEGYISFDNGQTFEQALTAQSKTEGKAFKVYDRQKRLISDSNALVYDPLTGEAITGVAAPEQISNGTWTSKPAGASCYGYKPKVSQQANDNDGDAGYVVQVQGKAAFAGSSQTGQYVIQQADLVRDCDTTISYGGKTWKFDRSNQKPYTEDASGAKTYGMSAVFAGDSIKPTMTVTYKGKTLVCDDDAFLAGGNRNGDFEYLYGPTSTDSTAPVQVDAVPNRNVSDKSAVTARFGSVGHLPDSWQTDVAQGFASYVTCSFKIDQADMSQCAVSGLNMAVGDTKSSVVSVKLNGIALQENTDYTVSYKDKDGNALAVRPTDKGDYKAVVAPKDNLKGDVVECSFSIVDAKTFQLNDIPDATFNGQDIYPQLTFTDAAGKALTLTQGVDYSVTILWMDGTLFSNTASDGNTNLAHLAPTDPASRSENGVYYQVRVTGLGSYAGCTQEKKFVYKALDVSKTNPADWQVVSATARWSYSNTGLVQWDIFSPYKVLYKNIVMDESKPHVYSNGGVDYSCQWVQMLAENKAVGSNFTWSIRGSSTTMGTLALNATGTVLPCLVTDGDLQVTIDQKSLIYSGSPKDPITLGYCQKDKDYAITYYDNTDAGTAHYVIEGKGNFTGKRSGTFTIKQADISSCSVDVDKAVYTGSAVQPAVTVKDAFGKTLDPAKDYTVSYTQNTGIGTGYAWVTGKGNYAGSASGSFDIAAPSTCGYTVKYVDQNGNSVAQAKTVSGVSLGATVSESAPDISGYALVDSKTSPASLTVGADDASNVIAFVYKAVSGSTDLSNAQIAPVKDQLVEVAVTYGSSEARSLLAQRGGTGFTSDEVKWSLGARPSPVVTVGGKTLAEGTDYTVSYSGNSNVTDHAAVTVTGAGAYSGSASASFKVVGYASHYCSVDADGKLSSISWETAKSWGTDACAVAYAQQDNVYYADGTPIRAADRTSDVPLLQPDATALFASADPSGSSTSIVPNALAKISTNDGRAEGRFGLNLSELKVTSKLGLVALPQASSAKDVYVYQGASLAPAVTAALADASSALAVKPASMPFLWSAMGIDSSAALGSEYCTVAPQALDASALQPIKYTLRYRNGLPLNATVSCSDKLAQQVADFAAAHPALKGRLSVADGVVGSAASQSVAACNLVVVPYDMSADGSGYAALSDATRQAVANKSADGTLPRGVSVSGLDRTWDGTPVQVSDLAPTVADSFGNQLVAGRDYSLKVADSTGADVSSVSGPGTYTATLTGSVSKLKDTGLVDASSQLGCYTGSATVSFKVSADAKYDLSNAQIAVDEESYTGSTIVPHITVKNIKSETVDSSAYTVAYTVKNTDGTSGVAVASADLVNVGDYFVTITGTGSASDPLSYTGCAKATLSIKAVGFQVDDIAPSVYDGASQTPAIAVKGISSSAEQLVQNKDFTVEYLDAAKNPLSGENGCTNTGSYWIRITGKGNYTGTIDKAFTIEPKSLAGVSMTATAVGAYAGTPVQAKTNIAGLAEGRDYQVVSYTGNDRAGMATVNVEGIGNYSGNATAQFKVQVDLSATAIASVDEQNYQGKSKPITPKPAVTFRGKTLQEGTDYAFSYANNIQPGTGSLTVAGSGDWYVGTKTLSFDIVAPTVSDSATGVEASGTAFVDEAADGSQVKLVVSKPAEHDDLFEEMKASYTTGNNELFIGYSIVLDKIAANGSQKSLKDGFGMLTLKFPVGDAYNGRTAMVVIRHTDDSDSVSFETRNVVIQDGCATLTVDRLSEFFVSIEKSTQDTGVVDQPVSDGSGISSSVPEAYSPSLLAPTGDAWGWLFEYSIPFFMVLGIVLVFAKRRMKKASMKNGRE